MKDFSFEKLHNDRKQLIKDNENNDHVIIPGNNNIMISSPHGVSQVRLGRLKYKEIGSLATALYLHRQTGCHFIAKTRNNNDDANFDLDCSYRKDLKKYIKDNNIKYLIDFHGLSPQRDIDVNLGIHLGKNIETNESLMQSLYNEISMQGFKCTIDQPFMAGARTVSGNMKKEFPNMWTIQIEINCGITNQPTNSTRFEKLLSVVYNWIKSIESC